MNNEYGFSIHQHIFGRDRMLTLLEALGRAELARTKAGARHVLAVPAVRALADEPVLVDIARQYLGATAFAFRATLFDKSLSTNWLVTWHQDTALPICERVDVDGWGPWTEKGGVLHAIAPAEALNQVVALRVHLDDSIVENGPLRVLPGTHNDGVLTQEQIHEAAANTNSVDCLVGMGGVIAMRPLIVHASSKARKDLPRRVLHIEYSATVDMGSGIRLVVG